MKKTKKEKKIVAFVKDNPPSYQDGKFNFWGCTFFVDESSQRWCIETPLGFSEKFSPDPWLGRIKTSWFKIDTDTDVECLSVSFTTATSLIMEGVITPDQFTSAEHTSEGKILKFSKIDFGGGLALPVIVEADHKGDFCFV